MIRFVFALVLFSTAFRAQSFAWGVNGHPVSQEGCWQVPLTTQLDWV